MGFRAFLAIPATGGGFFLSSWILMLFVGIVADDFGIRTIGYDTAMVATIGLWLAVAPLIGTVSRQKGLLQKRVVTTVFTVDGKRVDTPETDQES